MDAVYLVLQTMGSCVVQICCFVVMYKLFMKKINQQFETQKDIFQASVQKLTKQELSKSQIEKTNTDESNTLPVEEMMPDKGKKRSLPEFRQPTLIASENWVIRKRDDDLSSDAIEDVIRIFYAASSGSIPTAQEKNNDIANSKEQEELNDNDSSLGQDKEPTCDVKNTPDKHKDIPTQPDREICIEKDTVDGKQHCTPTQYVLHHSKKERHIHFHGEIKAVMIGDQNTQNNINSLDPGGTEEQRENCKIGTSPKYELPRRRRKKRRKPKMKRNHQTKDPTKYESGTRGNKRLPSRDRMSFESKVNDTKSATCNDIKAEQEESFICAPYALHSTSNKNGHEGTSRRCC